MASAAIDNLPDSDFAYIEPGGTKDASGKTVPRSLRHFPIHDAAHVRNALARLSQSPFEAKARPKVEAAAKRMGIGEPAGKASVAALEAAQGACVLSEMYQVAACESDEPEQFAILNEAIGLWTRWLEQERGEINGPDDDEMEEPEMMGKAAWGEIKAEPFTTNQLDRWLAGQIPRRMLAIPFGGPIPSPLSPRGVDIDGEWFSERTDLYAGHKALIESRERLVDFHHGDDPLGVMGDGRYRGVILGKAIIDPSPERDGYWVDFWAKAGERRLALVKALEERGAALYGSSESAPGWAKDKATGEILVWPWIRQTISTSPQNTLAVMPPLKALLTADLPFEEVGLAAIKAALVGLGDVLDAQSKIPVAAVKAPAARVEAPRTAGVNPDIVTGLRELAELTRP